MRAADLTTALLVMAGGLLVLWDSLRVGIGWSTDGPRSGFFPFWLAVVLLLCVAGIVVQTIRRGDRRAFGTPEAPGPVPQMLLPAAPVVPFVPLRRLYLPSP